MRYYPFISMYKIMMMMMLRKYHKTVKSTNELCTEQKYVTTEQKWSENNGGENFPDINERVKLKARKLLRVNNLFGAFRECMIGYIKSFHLRNDGEQTHFHYHSCDVNLSVSCSCALQFTLIHSNIGYFFLSIFFIITLLSERIWSNIFDCLPKLAI